MFTLSLDWCFNEHLKIYFKTQWFVEMLYWFFKISFLDSPNCRFGAMEIPQHGNGPTQKRIKKTNTSPK